MILKKEMEKNHRISTTDRRDSKEGGFSVVLLRRKPFALISGSIGSKKLTSSGAWRSEKDRQTTPSCLPPSEIQQLPLSFSLGDEWSWDLSEGFSLHVLLQQSGSAISATTGGGLDDQRDRHWMTRLPSFKQKAAPGEITWNMKNPTRTRHTVLNRFILPRILNFFLFWNVWEKIFIACFVNHHCW